MTSTSPSAHDRFEIILQRMTSYFMEQGVWKGSAAGVLASRLRQAAETMRYRLNDAEVWRLYHASLSLQSSKQMRYAWRFLRRYAEVQNNANAICPAIIRPSGRTRASAYRGETVLPQEVHDALFILVQECEIPPRPLSQMTWVDVVGGGKDTPKVALRKVLRTARFGRATQCYPELNQEGIEALDDLREWASGMGTIKLTSEVPLVPMAPGHFIPASAGLIKNITKIG